MIPETWNVVQGDCLEVMRSLPEQSVDLVFGSPPYESARWYLENGDNLGIARKTEEWVAWMVEVYRESLRVCKGLVAFVVEGQTKDYRYSAGPALLMADLHRAGIHLRKPPIYHRVGIPGSGGPDWLRNDWEWIICATNGGKLPWSDNTACGHPPKWAPGGEMSHRLSDGARVNQWGKYLRSDGEVTGADGDTEPGRPAAVKRRPSHKFLVNERRKDGSRGMATSKRKDGDNKTESAYDPPAKANPGNVIHCEAGGGLMGNKLCHENEAPFPEKLAEFFILSFCPPGGIVLDPFSGSGTTVAVAYRNNRRALGIDLRQSQVDLAKRRLQSETPMLF